MDAPQSAARPQDERRLRDRVPRISSGHPGDASRTGGHHAVRYRRRCRPGDESGPDGASAAERAAGLAAQESADRPAGEGDRRLAECAYSGEGAFLVTRVTATFTTRIELDDRG